MGQSLLQPLQKDHADFLRDESRRAGTAESISFPRTEREVREVLSFCYREDIPVTVQGARTGITAGATPAGGHILNLSRMDRILGLRRHPHEKEFYLRVQPGVTLAAIREALAERKFDTADWEKDSREALEKLQKTGRRFFPPDPTEASASIGGMAAANASGACSFHYGPTRDYIQALRAVLADGSPVSLRRDIQHATGRSFALRSELGDVIEGTLPDYTLPAVKNAAGYHAAPDMPLLHFFIGSEGTLGVITELELHLVPAPAFRWALMAFFPEEAPAIRYVRAIRGERVSGVGVAPALRPVAIEFFNHDILELRRRQKAANPAFTQVPDILSSYHTAIYAEYHGEREDTLSDALMTAAEIVVICGGDVEATWSAATPREMERLVKFRHAAPETVNLVIDERRRTEPALTKLGTDMAVPDPALEIILQMYNDDLTRSGLESVIFGHVGNNHLHVNILPNNQEEYLRGRDLYLNWARQAVQMGGTVSGEHGIGKLKTPLLREMYGGKGVEQMRALKRLFDPKGILNRGNLFEMP